MGSPFLDAYNTDKYELSTSMTPIGLGGNDFKDKIFVGGGFFYPNGYGVCYCPLQNETFFTFSASKSDKSRSVKNYSTEVQIAISNLVDLLK